MQTRDLEVKKQTQSEPKSADSLGCYSTDSGIDRKEITRKLLKTANKRKNLERELTSHIVTRWYRAPEIILLEKDYGPAVDMWGLGCITGELYSLLKECSATFLDREPLFKGKSCFPLSPSDKPHYETNGFPMTSND